MPIGDGTLASVLDNAARADSRSARTMAAALTSAAADGVDRILVLGRHQRESSDPDVDGAVAAARETGVEVVFLPALAERRTVTVLDLLLPGSGRVERLVESGRRAAARWLESRREAAHA